MNEKELCMLKFALAMCSIPYVILMLSFLIEFITGYFEDL